MNIRFWAAAAAVTIGLWTGGAKADFLTVNLYGRSQSGQAALWTISYDLGGLQINGGQSAISGDWPETRAYLNGTFRDGRNPGVEFSAALTPDHWTLQGVFASPAATSYLDVELFAAALPGIVTQAFTAYPGANSFVREHNSTGNETIYSVTTMWAGISSAVPEPSTWAMMLLGLGGLAFAARRRSIA